MVAAVAAVPTFTPSDNLRAFNDLARFIGDDRASQARGEGGDGAPVHPSAPQLAGMAVSPRTFRTALHVWAMGSPNMCAHALHIAFHAGALQVRKQWGRPLKAVVVTGSGVL